MEKLKFINLKNHKTYTIQEFATRKDVDSGDWWTVVAYTSEESEQLFIRDTQDFFLKFIPKAQWDSASVDQRKKLEGQ